MREIGNNYARRLCYNEGTVRLTHSVYSRACLFSFTGSEPKVVLSDLSIVSTGASAFCLR